MAFSYGVLRVSARNPEEVTQCAVAKEGKGPDCPSDGSDKCRWVRKWENDGHVHVSQGILNMA